MDELTATRPPEAQILSDYPPPIGLTEWHVESILGREDYHAVVEIRCYADTGTELTARAWSRPDGLLAVLELVAPDGAVVGQAFAVLPPRAEEES